MKPLNKLDPQSTALVLIDLQKGITEVKTEPYSSEVVISNSNKLVNIFHNEGALVIFVRVAMSADFKDALHPEADETPWASNTPRPADWSDIVPELDRKEHDFIITKHQWGAFYGTELDLQLRRRGIKTIVLGGIATNYGVESTARDAYEHGYQLIFASDAMSSRKASDHEFAITRIFPRIGRVRNTSEIVSAFIN